MSIKLLGYKAFQVVFRPSGELIDYLEGIDKLESIPTIQYASIFPDEVVDEFLIHFDFSFDDKELVKDGSGLFKIDFVARFKSEDPITQEFKDSHFPRVNAPAIAYPFLRAFVNNFFINAGYNPVLLPTYNFTKPNQYAKEASQ